MEPTNISVIGTQLTSLTNNIINLITFKDIYSYIFLEILILSFYIAMEANRVESIKTLMLGIAIDNVDLPVPGSPKINNQ